jgi:hypothetical protein
VTTNIIPPLVTKALGLLIEQYHDQPNLTALVSVFAAEVQQALDAANQLFNLTSIDNSSGVQLDIIGARLGEDRQGFDDADYRLHLKARILLNRSSGTIEDIVSMFAQVTGAGPVVLREYTPAIIWVTLGGIAVDPTVVSYLVNFLGTAKVGGVWPILQWSEHPPSQTFAFAGATGIGFDSGWWSSAE